MDTPKRSRQIFGAIAIADWHLNLSIHIQKPAKGPLIAELAIGAHKICSSLWKLKKFDAHTADSWHVTSDREEHIVDFL
ncbi:MULTISPECIES: hypothetical protein [Hansschlegelia]|uniref:Uncharacterized protein n=1 Tax=Hansschlegelia zhihuaiae TaxID=405005 RepID=A0A4Q0MF16_9HYPH|nr:hypothetical protein [Hansschlegelia zhihuaiae]RXF71476.1 hypothetical protein EK403_15515 [Hansschlegelia zhihuaiae]